jgi:hypothetical protein
MTMQVSNLHLYTHETGSAGVSMPDLTTMVLIAGLAGVAGFTLGYGVRDFHFPSPTPSRESASRSRNGLGRLGTGRV